MKLPIGARDPGDTRGNRYNYFIIPAVVALALAACGDGDQEDQPTAPNGDTTIEQPADEASSANNADTVATTTLDQETIDLLSQIDTSDEYLLEVTGMTRDQALELANEQRGFSQAMVEAMDVSFPELGYTESDYPNYPRITLEHILNGDVEATNDFLQLVQMQPSAIIDGLNQLEAKIMPQLKQAEVVQVMLDEKGPTNGTVGSVSENATAIYSIQGAQNQALSFHALTVIAEGLVNGTLQIDPDASVDNIDPSNIYEADDSSLQYKIGHEDGFVVLPNGPNTETYHPRYQLDTMGIVPVFEPLPGVNVDEARLTPDMVYAQALNIVGQNERGSLPAGDTTAFAKEVNELADMVWPKGDITSVPDPGNRKPDVDFITR